MLKGYVKEGCVEGGRLNVLHKMATHPPSSSSSPYKNTWPHPGLPRYIAVKFDVPWLRLSVVIYNLHRG